MDITHTPVRRDGQRIRFTVHQAEGSGRIEVSASDGHKTVVLHGRRTCGTTLVLDDTLKPGRWTLSITGTPSAGFTVLGAQRMKLTVPRG